MFYKKTIFRVAFKNGVSLVQIPCNPGISMIK